MKLSITILLLSLTVTLQAYSSDPPYASSVEAGTVCNECHKCNGPTEPCVELCKTGPAIFTIPTFESGTIIFNVTLKSNPISCGENSITTYRKINLAVKDGSNTWPNQHGFSVDGGIIRGNRFEISCVRKNQPLQVIVSGTGDYKFEWYYSEIIYSDEEPNDSEDTALQIVECCNKKGNLFTGSSGGIKDRIDHYYYNVPSSGDYFLHVQSTSTCIDYNWINHQGIDYSIAGRKGFLFRDLNELDVIRFSLSQKGYCIYDCHQYELSITNINLPNVFAGLDYCINEDYLTICNTNNDEIQLINDNHGFVKLQGGLKWNNGLTSVEVLSENEPGGIIYTIDRTNQQLVVGLSKENYTDSLSDITYGIYLQQATYGRMLLYIIEGGNLVRKFATVYLGESILIERNDDGKVRYYTIKDCDLKLLYESEDEYQGCLLFDSSVKTENGKISRVGYFGEWKESNCDCE